MIKISKYFYAAATLLISLLFVFSSCRGDAESDVGTTGAVSTAAQTENTAAGTVVTDTAADDTDDSTAADTGQSDPEPLRISFIAAGDNIVYYGNVREAEEKSVPGGRAYNFAHQFGDIAQIIEEADIAFVNQETLMAGDGYKLSYYPRFNSPRDMGHDIIDTGFDIVNIANNHMLDWGADALYQTALFWRNETPAFTIGDYLANDEYENIRVYEEQGVKIAFLSYTYGTNLGFDKYSTGVVVPYLDEKTVVRQVQSARACADLVFVSVHWGDENSFRPNSSQEKYAQLMCDLGADVIIGHHPHVIQPVLWLENGSGHKTLCAYSLGNLAAEMAGGYNMVGALLSFDIISGSGKEPYIADPLFIPTVYYYNMSFRDNRVYLMENFTESLAASHGIGYYGNSTTLKKLRSYVTDTVDADFLPDFLK